MMTHKRILSSEFGFIRWIRNRTPVLPAEFLVGIGDDCAVIKPPPGAACVVTTDSVVEGVHFSPGTSPCLVGRKAMARGLSDIAAMGVQPAFCVAGICFSRRNSPADARAVYKGMRCIADMFGVKIIGGDVSASKGDRLFINVTAVGWCSGLGVRSGKLLPAITRSGAKDRDAIMVTNTLGGSILSKHLTFIPRINEAIRLNEHFCLHAMMDISDGLVADLGHILEESACAGAELFEEAIPVSVSAVKLSAKSRRPPLYHALYDGEDYELLMTCPEAEARRIIRWARGRMKITVIGRVSKKAKGISLFHPKGGRRQLATTGYEHRIGRR